MSLFEPFLQNAQKLGLPNVSLLLAVSGGLDSVVLAHLCREARFSFSIAHCNFGLRGEESERDETFVRNLADRLSVPVFVERFDTSRYAAQQKQSIQEAARQLRYQWFAQLKKEHRFGFVLLAHHANDNLETVVMNFFRGTGLQGLTGIPEVREGYLVRPLLPFRRKEIESYARQKGLEWVEDSSNDSDKYTRNFFRRQLLPLIQQYYPQADENVLRNAARLQSALSLYEEGYHYLYKKLVEVEGNISRIPILKLKPYLHTSFLFEWVKGFHFSEKQLPDILRLPEAGNGKFVASETHQIIRHNRWLIMAPKQNDTPLVTIEEGQEEVRFAGGVLHIKKLRKEKWQLDKVAHTAQLDARLVQFPLILRRWKAGDYFYPLGMRKKKKLSRFFIDSKLSKNEKENIWVLESNKKIIWVVGRRIDDRFKITEATTGVIQFNWTSP
jgi:tRNA(Ile)-lysidine synthase